MSALRDQLLTKRDQANTEVGKLDKLVCCSGGCCWCSTHNNCQQQVSITSLQIYQAEGEYLQADYTLCGTVFKVFTAYLSLCQTCTCHTQNSLPSTYTSASSPPHILTTTHTTHRGLRVFCHQKTQFENVIACCVWRIDYGVCLLETHQRCVRHTYIPMQIHTHLCRYTHTYADTHTHMQIHTHTQPVSTSTCNKTSFVAITHHHHISYPLYIITFIIIIIPTIITQVLELEQQLAESLPDTLSRGGKGIFSGKVCGVCVCVCVQGA